MHRVTAWRIKKGITQKHMPKGKPDYRAVAWRIVKRYYPFLLEISDDVKQEIELLVILVERENNYGSSNKRGCVGMRRYSRMVGRCMYRMSKNYGMYRHSKELKGVFNEP